MIEESLLEFERRGSFIRVYPNEQHVQQYRNFFEEERTTDNILYNYIYNYVNFEQFYKNLTRQFWHAFTHHEQFKSCHFKNVML